MSFSFSAGWEMDGDIAYIRIFAGALSDSEIESYIGYLKSSFSI